MYYNEYMAFSAEEKTGLLEEFVERIGAPIDFHAQLPVKRIVEYRNIPHGPFYTSLVEVDDIPVLIVEHLPGEIDCDIRLRGQHKELYLP